LLWDKTNAQRGLENHSHGHAHRLRHESPLDSDGSHLHIQSRKAVVGLTFIPPLAIALIWQEVFLQALNIVGGVGIVILFGILPCIIFLKKADAGWKKILGVLMLLLFLGCLVCEIGQEAGLMQIKPEIEQWAPQVQHMKLN